MRKRGKGHSQIRITNYTHKLIKVFAAARDLDLSKAAEELVTAGFRSLEKKPRAQDSVPILKLGK